jgi:hypothetical protein
MFQEAVTTNSKGTAVKGIKASKLKRTKVVLSTAGRTEEDSCQDGSANVPV